MPEMQKFVQISVFCPPNDESNSLLYALDEEGVIWYQRIYGNENQEWFYVPTLNCPNPTL
jgi:hypothetical protein